MYKFRPNGETGVIDLEDGAVIPPDPMGYRWQAYLDWMRAGNEALPADEIVFPLPNIPKTTVIERLTDTELEWIESARASQPARARLMWEAAQTLDPNNETLRQFLQSVIGPQRMEEVLAR